LCDICGHPRASHFAVYKKGKRRCIFRSVDIQSLRQLPCNCSGYVPIEGNLAEASFATPETGPIPRLRPPRTNRS
jgi:hypothetical protein